MGSSILQSFIQSNLARFRQLPANTTLEESLSWWSARAKEQLSPVEADRLVRVMTAGAVIHATFPPHRAERLTRAIGLLHYSESDTPACRSGQNSKKRSAKGFAMAR